jgi:signal peptidase II
MGRFGRDARRVLLIALVLGTIGCDRVTKQVALTTLAGRPGRSFLSDTIRLQYAENAGGFLSWGAEWPPAVRTAVFAGATAVLQIGLLWVAVRRRWAGGAWIGVLLCVAGGGSNWVDRLLHGRVIDFLNVGYGPVRTGIFNVADVAVMLGGAVLLIALSRSEAGESGPAATSAP